MVEPHRLGADAPHGFGGSGLDRRTAVSFRLDGHVLSGFVGDTVLSALLANGIVAMGNHDGAPIRLDEAFVPLVAPRAEPGSVMPIDRLMLVDGLDLVTLGAAPRRQSLLARLLRRDSPPCQPLLSHQRRQPESLLTKCRRSSDLDERLPSVSRRTGSGRD